MQKVKREVDIQNDNAEKDISKCKNVAGELVIKKFVIGILQKVDTLSSFINK